jgi:hypothetical protein
MRILVTLTLAILAAGCGARQDAAIAQNQAQPKGAQMVVQPRGAEAPADCALRVEFGSYAMGIDREASRAVDQLLAGDPAVTSVELYPWGREGEKTLCVRLRSEADAERLARAISALFPAEPRGPLSVSTRNGLRFSAGRG